MLIAIFISEIICTLLIVYGFMHEKELLQFEDKVRRVIRKIKIGLCVKCLKKEGFVVKKTEGE